MTTQKIKYFEVDDSKTIYTIKNNTYSKVKTLGEGSFGKVIKVKKENAVDGRDSNYFSIKISKRFKKVSKGNNTPKNEKKKEKEEKPIELNFMEIRELIIMKKIRHPNLINLIDYKFCREDRSVWILMDYLPTDLAKFFEKKKSDSKVMNEKFFKKIAFQILDGVRYLHQKNIIHRDLKLENILYDEEKNLVRITDFGLSRQFDYNINSQFTDVGTYPYKPPELILGLHHYSTGFDVWSVGCIFVEIIIGEHLFGEDNALGVLKRMINIFGSFKEKDLPGFQYFPNSNLLENIPNTEGIGLVNYIKQKRLFDFENDNFYDLIQKMLCLDPTKRISSKECLSHPWFLNPN